MKPSISERADSHGGLVKDSPAALLAASSRSFRLADIRRGIAECALDVSAKLSGDQDLPDLGTLQARALLLQTIAAKIEGEHVDE